MRRGGEEEREGGGGERAVKTHHMLHHASPCEENSGTTASDMTPYTKSNGNKRWHRTGRHILTQAIAEWQRKYLLKCHSMRDLVLKCYFTLVSFVLEAKLYLWTCTETMWVVTTPGHRPSLTRSSCSYWQIPVDPRLVHTNLAGRASEQTYTPLAKHWHEHTALVCTWTLVFFCSPHGATLWFN